MTPSSATTRVAAAVLFAMVAGGLIPGPAAPRLCAAEKHILAQGRVLTQTGEGLAGWPVLLVATQRFIELKSFSSGGDVATVARATTDANGYFSIDVPKDRHFQFWFLRFAEPGQLDTVKYRMPADVEITAEARRGRVTWLDKTIEMHPDWPEVERRVAESGGEATPRGKILRTLGLPEKSVRDEAGGVEEWWYFTRGILYTFRGPQPVGERRFDPVAPPAASGREGL